MSRRKKANQTNQTNHAWDEVKKKSKKYSDYILANLNDVCSEVDEEFESRRDEIRDELLDLVAENVKGCPIHYERYYDGNPYDYSGELREVGDIDLDQTISDFLDNEYVGNWMPTFVSHYGKQWVTYGDRLSEDTLEIGETILSDVVNRFLERAFPDKEDQAILSDRDVAWCVRDAIHDPIYDNTLTCEFFFWEEAVNFADIGEIKLRDLIPEQKYHISTIAANASSKIINFPQKETGK